MQVVQCDIRCNRYHGELTQTGIFRLQPILRCRQSSAQEEEEEDALRDSRCCHRHVIDGQGNPAPQCGVVNALRQSGAWRGASWCLPLTTGLPPFFRGMLHNWNTIGIRDQSRAAGSATRLSSLLIRSSFALHVVKLLRSTCEFVRP